MVFMGTCTALLRRESRVARNGDASTNRADKARPMGPSASSQSRLWKGTGIPESPSLSGLYLLP